MHIKCTTGTPTKRQANLAKHRLDFDHVFDFDWDVGSVRQDSPSDYGEERFIADGFIDGRQHVLVFAIREGRIRVISLRKANARERKRYERAQKLH